MFNKNKIKKISVIIGITMIILWFGGNLGFYLYIKNYILSPNNEKFIDYIPEKLKIEGTDVEAESFQIFGLKFRFPFYKEDISYIYPSLFMKQLHLVNIHIGDKDNVSNILFSEIPNNPGDVENSLISQIWNKVQYNNNSSFDLRRVFYSRLKDYSWWNILHNIRLANLLAFKAMEPGYGYETLRIYDLETPYLKGILIEKEDFKKYITFDFSFELNDNMYSITFIRVHPDNSNKIRNILTTIQPVDDIEKSYKEIEALYKNKDKSKYPEELLLLSMISIKGPTVDNLKELLKIMKDKNYEPYIIEMLKEEIESLRT